MTDVLDTLTRPGGPFEVVTEDVRGVSLQVYKSRLRSMRDLIDMSNGRGDTDFVVQGDRREVEVSVRELRSQRPAEVGRQRREQLVHRAG